MTREQAIEMAKAIKGQANFSGVRVCQEAGEFAQPSDPWQVDIWVVNPAAGNRNLTVVRDYAPAEAPAFARLAQQRATKRDRAALARIQAEREREQSN